MGVIKEKKQRELFMRAAIQEARRGVLLEEGGPFGAVIVRNNKIISRAHNLVLANNDPTAHAEIVALQAASKTLGRYHLSDCELYSACEPCPMCLAALYWARIRNYYYGCTSEDVAILGFSDERIYSLIRKRRNRLGNGDSHIMRDECIKILKIWDSMKNKKIY